MIRHSLMAALFLSAVALPAAAQEKVLRFANFIPPNVSYSVVFQEFADAVTRDSGGALKIQMYHGGTLGSNSSQQLKLVQDGVADMAFIVTSLTANRFPETEVTEVPFLVRNAREGARALWKLNDKGMLPSYADLKLLGLITTSAQVLNSRAPVKSLEDLKGLRLRVTGGLGLEAVKALNAAPVQIGGGEVAESLSRGVIDGLLGEPDFIKTFKMQRFVKHHTLVPFGAPTMLVAMRKDAYDALPAAARAALDKHAGLAFSEKWAANNMAGNSGGLQTFKDEGNIVTELDAAEAAKWQAALKPVVDGWLAKRPENPKMYEAMQQALREVRAQ